MSEYSGTIGALAFVAVMVVLFIREIRGYATAPIPESASDAWLECARALKGRFSPPSGIHAPRIDFLLAGRTAFIRFIVKNARSLKGRTSIRVNVAGLSPGQLTLASTGRKRLSPGSVSDPPDFDRYFACRRAEPRSIASRLLADPAKEALVRPLLGLRRFGPVTVVLGEQDLFLEVGALLVEPSVHLELASVTETVMKGFFGAEAAFPIELVDVSNPLGARCSVCRSELRESIVRCMACHTPHHVDCWRFNTRCSTYGCGETRYLPEPAPAAVLNPEPPT